MGAKTWGPKDIDRLRELAAEGRSGAEIGDILGYSRSAVCGKCFREAIVLKSRPVRPTNRPNLDLDRMRREVEHTVKSFGVIAYEMGCDRTTVSYYARLKHWTRPADAPVPAVRLKPKPKPRPSAEVKSKPKAKPSLRLVVSEPDRPVEPKSLLERGLKECAWPVSGDGADTMFCCRPVARGAYCAAHFVKLCGKGTEGERRAADTLLKMANV